MPTIPYLFVKNEAEDLPAKLMLLLSQAPHPFVVRFTGGCGNMSASDAEDLNELFASAFESFKGAIIFGGTRMVRSDGTVVPGIMEIPPYIKSRNNVMILGVIPKVGDSNLRLLPSGLLVENQQETNGFVTIVHPELDFCLLVQKSANEGVIWDVEYQECMKITELLRKWAGWRSLLISYNGGETTEKEIAATARKGWPVLLVEGSGRVTDKFASDAAFLGQHPHVHVAQKNPDSIRRELIATGAVTRRS